MTPKRIGFVGFDGVTASHLVGPADTFSAAALDDGYSNRIPCYEIHVIGLSSACCRAESGMIFTPEETLEAVSEWDTIVVPGGKGLRKPEVCERIADWILTRVNQTRRIAAIGTGIYGLATTGFSMGVKSRLIGDMPAMWRNASQICALIPEDPSLRTARFILLRVLVQLSICHSL
jgi:transcriptional regulator GlxA family with amidase domain